MAARLGLRLLPRLAAALERRRLRHRLGDAPLRRLPLGLQRGADHGGDEALDGVAVGVVRAELAALVRVEAALEQGAEDGGVDVGPIERGGALDDGDVVRLQGQRGRVIEQAAVEPGHLVIADAPALVRHRGEELARERGGLGGLLPGGGQHPLEQAGGQEADVVGEGAEGEAGKEVRHRVRLVPPGPQAIGDFGELGGGLLGECLPGGPRAQALGLREGPFQELKLSRVG